MIKENKTYVALNVLLGPALLKKVLLKLCYLAGNIFKYYRHIELRTAFDLQLTNLLLYIPNSELNFMSW